MPLASQSAQVSPEFAHGLAGEDVIMSFDYLGDGRLPPL